MEVNVPVGSNHGNLFSELLSLVRGLYKVLHAEVNVTVVQVIDGKGTTSRAGQCGRDGTGEA